MSLLTLFLSKDSMVPDRCLPNQQLVNERMRNSAYILKHIKIALSIN